MRSVARWCYQHRFLVLAGWILVMAAAFFGQSATGSNYSAGAQLSGTPSAQAASLLQRAAPSVSGDTEQIVFTSKTGPVTSPAVQTRIDAMLAQVSHLRYVGSISSPYTSAGTKQISASRTIAFASVSFTKDASVIPASEATQLVKLARAPNSPQLQVDVVGNVAAATNPSSSSSTLYGIATAFIVLLIVFGSLIPALLPLFSTLIGLLAGLSVVGMVSNAIPMASFTSQLCTLIGLGVGIDYSLFILTRVRSGLRRGLSPQEAVTVAASTAGRAVLFAGITVCIALLGMLTVGVGVLSGAAIGASIAVLFPMLAAQTLLPALAGIAGKRLLTRRQRAALSRGGTGVNEASARWAAWARRVEAHRIVFALGAAGILAALAVPFFSMRQGTADYSTDPTSTSTTTYRGYEMLGQGFGPGFSGPLQLVAPISGTAGQSAFAAVTAAAAHTPGVVTTTRPVLLPAGPGHPAVAVAEVYPATSPQAAATSGLITRLRDRVIPAAEHGSTLNVLVGGQTAQADDAATQLSAKLPYFVGMVVALSFILLMIVFRSLVIPATAAVMNLFSAAASFGVIVAVFQWGWLDRLVGVSHTGPIPPLVPILMFAVLFGLSMDYEVFLVSRIHEEWLKLRDNSAAVNRGQAITGRTITAAAAIMIVVFSSFVITTDRTVKMLGLGMAVAVLVDALLIRTVLVPALMHIMGKANWALPAVLDRRLPRLELEAAEPPESARPAGNGESDSQTRPPRKHSALTAEPARAPIPKEKRIMASLRTSPRRSALGLRPARLTRTGSAPRAVPPTFRRLAAAGLAAAAVSLAADVVLATIGQAAFTVPASFTKFSFATYGLLTILGIVGATVAWGVVTRLSSRPRWLLIRLAAGVSALLLIPDFLLLGTPGNPTGPVMSLMLMHLAIAAITYSVLVRVAPSSASAAPA